MIAGRLTYKLEMLRPERVTDAYGAEKDSFVSVGVCHAERVKLTGYGHDEVGEHFADYRAVFRVRDAHKILEQWRVRELGGLTYVVVSIEPNRERGMLTLNCEKLNQ